IPDYAKLLQPDLKPRRSLKIGIISETFGQGLDPIVEQAVTHAIDQLQNLGAEI
ncbi:MAG TPA: Asp-tRNA(Asn)/Glu-tRNA(Gln) amidotransferase GatCAB subunit A, partial [Cyanobacteria bacterium UBA8543]|nr:Asp-tRNA(Asn)/Glu-tRNA(Gln) amidotransferase GatCAB subunit A [Cyanobacteria bacterium UBA8543]